MQGMAAQAQEEHNSSVIRGLVGAMWRGFTLYTASAATLIPVLPWLRCGDGDS